MNLPTLQPSDLPDLLDEHPIEVRDKSDARIEHWPILAIAWVFVVLSGKDWSDFQQGVPCIFGYPEATYYTHGDLSASDVTIGNVSQSDMPYIIHELTHCSQWIELGVMAGVAYVFWPLVTYWTSRSTLEFEADANEILSLVYRYGYRTEWVDRLCGSSADIFSSSTYFWATTDREGWYRAMKRIIAYSRIEDGPVDARDAMTDLNIEYLFGGYNLRSQ